MKTESASHGKKGKREYLKESETKSLLDDLNRFFETKVAVKRIRNGEHQTIETLINEEAFLLAKYFRNERKEWIPRTAPLESIRTVEPKST